MEKNAPIRSLPFQYGKYELLQRLGSGGMAEIFLARQAGAAGFEKLTVIKRILPQLGHDERMEAAFIAEARLMAEIRHHNVVHVYELDRLPSGEFFMAMEYIDGTDLRLLLKTAKRAGLRLPPWLSVKITCDILDALRVVHNLADDRGRPRNVVHRDVTPSNIFVSKQGDVKLGDFGVAKDDQRTALTRHGELKGKISYMAPEQLSRGEVDKRADLFAMGVVLWECLAQRRLFGGGEVPEMVVMNRVCSGPRIAPSRFRSDVHPGLDECALRALNIDPDARHQSAEGFQTELIELLDALHGPVHSAEICEITDMIVGKRAPSARFSLAAVTTEASGRDASWDTLTGIDAPTANTEVQAAVSEPSYRGPFPFWLKANGAIKGPIHYFDAVAEISGSAEVYISADRVRWLDAKELADLTGQDALRPHDEEQTSIIHGALQKKSLIAILASLAFDRATGVLRISAENRALIHIREGRLTHVGTEAPQLQATELLVRDGSIQPADIPAVVHQMLLEALPLEELAVRAGWARDRQTFWRSVMKRRLFSMMDSLGDYDVFSLEPHVRGALQIDLLEMIGDLVRHGTSTHGLRKRLHGSLDLPFAVHPHFEERFECFRPDELDRDVVHQLLHARTLQAALRLAPDDEFLLLCWAHLLFEAKLLLPEDTEARSSGAMVAE